MIRRWRKNAQDGKEQWQGSGSRGVGADGDAQVGFTSLTHHGDDERTDRIDNGGAEAGRRFCVMVADFITKVAGARARSADEDGGAVRWARVMAGATAAARAACRAATRTVGGIRTVSNQGSTRGAHGCVSAAWDGGPDGDSGMAGCGREVARMADGATECSPAPSSSRIGQRARVDR